MYDEYSIKEDAMVEISEPIDEPDVSEAPARPSEKELGMIVAGIVRNAAGNAESKFRQSLSENTRTAVEALRARNERLRELGSERVPPWKPVTNRISLRLVLIELDHELVKLKALHEGVARKNQQDLQQLREEYLGFTAEDLEVLYEKLQFEADKLKVAANLGLQTVDQARAADFN